MTHDPGLQQQRTTLAWTRTGVASGVLAALMLREAFHSGEGLAAVRAGIAVLGTVGILATGSRALRPLRRLPGPQRPCDHRGVRIVTGIVLVLSLVAAGSLLPS